ncbi:PQ-loop-domain-containing protein [Macrolepiota fuliginosa MF-IS2]|uniref:PQ-loop-domain-containing protein n=1 Tax=Macrolepiota fuliginosa MF-IS2 TaxID=1400762 RepID=A0A9P5XQ04_9AGAR|nr:PQ-loop-domain-containing protein [Macrolepiota fuliginosa MF-IS2]
MQTLDGDTLSSIFGWISIGCWIIVYSPQLYENYRIQSGEGLSVLFLLAWVTGDLCNLFGAILGGLVPTVIVLACYYAFFDFTLLAQVYYYRWKRSRWPIGPFYDLPTPNTSTTALASDAGFGDGSEYDHRNYDYEDDGYDRELEQEPLLRSARRHGGKLPPAGADPDAGAGGEEEETLGRLVLKYALCLVFVSAFGIGAWWVDEGRFGTTGWGGFPGNGGEWGEWEWMREWVVQVLGWTSALLYLGASFPQIFKNVETRCEGLSLGLFVFMIFGSFTYAASICAKSTDREYLIINASWLVGHCLTGVLDGVIIAQIVYYRFTRRGRAGGMNV